MRYSSSHTLRRNQKLHEQHVAVRSRQHRAPRLSGPCKDRLEPGRSPARLSLARVNQSRRVCARGPSGCVHTCGLWSRRDLWF